MPIYTGPTAGPTKTAGNTELNADGSVMAQAKQYPADAAFSSWGRLEPLLTPEQLRSRYLKGISMTLRIKDPGTGKFFQITDEELKDYIEDAVVTAEEETSLTIMPTQFVEKLPFQKQDFEAFGYWQLPRKPVASIETLTVTLADGSTIFNFPTQWIETSNLIRGQLNIVPLAFQGLEAGGGVVGGGINAGGGTAIFFNSLWNRPWVAALFGITYTCGFASGLLPRVVNQLIGTIAAMHVLSMIAAAYAAYTSTSLGVDGLSQSVGTSGPQRYQVRMEELKAERALCVKKLKKSYGSKFVVGNI